MSSSRQAPAILASLDAVTRERHRRDADAALSRRVDALKSYQQARFRLGYADLLADPRYAPAASFFLDELYGPSDFTRRDAQFARVVPALVRLFPSEIVQTVATLAELHALSESLDTAMASALEDEPRLDASAYAASWRAVGRAPEREAQIALMLDVGRALDAHTRKPMLATSLRLMRGPARAAGLSELQGFLERGFESFRAMRGADHFIATVAQRERALMRRLFDARSDAVASGQLP